MIMRLHRPKRKMRQFIVFFRNFSNKVKLKEIEDFLDEDYLENNKKLKILKI